MMDNNYHNGYHDPDCWCYDRNKGSGGNMGCFGTIITAVLLLIGTLVVLTLIITAFGAEVDDIPSGVLMFLFIIIMSVIGGVVSSFKK